MGNILTRLAGRIHVDIDVYRPARLHMILWSCETERFLVCGHTGRSGPTSEIEAFVPLADAGVLYRPGFGEFFPGLKYRTIRNGNISPILGILACRTAGTTRGAACRGGCKTGDRHRR